jgi:hypothetical protein
MATCISDVFEIISLIPFIIEHEHLDVTDWTPVENSSSNAQRYYATRCIPNLI